MKEYELVGPPRYVLVDGVVRYSMTFVCHKHLYGEIPEAIAAGGQEQVVAYVESTIEKFREARRKERDDREQKLASLNVPFVVKTHGKKLHCRLTYEPTSLGNPQVRIDIVSPIRYRVHELIGDMTRDGERLFDAQGELGLWVLTEAKRSVCRMYEQVCLEHEKRRKWPTLTALVDSLNEGA